MNPSTAQARVVVDELVRNGVRHVVLSPGSRNAPLSLAMHQAALASRLRLHVRIDERSAAFLALGLAARTRRPVVVCSTSGTAAANFHPAVLEADRSGVPLMVLTADRPPELRAAGANQVVDQHRLYGPAVRLFAELAVAEYRVGQNSYWRSEVCRAWHAARGDWWTTAGPVHLNLPFRDPLVPDVGGDPNDDWCEPLAGRPEGLPWTEVSDQFANPSMVSPGDGRGLVLVCEGLPQLAMRWAEEHGWPVLAETGGAGLGGPNAISAGAWLLACEEFLAEHRPDQVVCVGRPTVFRQVMRLLADSGVEVYLVHDGNDWPAPGHDVREVGQALGAPFRDRDPEWLASWQRAEKAATVALHAALDAEPWPTGMHVARDLVDALPTGGLLVLGSSNPTRDVALAAHARPDVLVHRNRGVAGIDGMVSTAIGAALAHDGPSYALLGDLTFLHDSNGLLIGPDEDRPDLTIVVLNDDGGGIFSLLEQGAPEHEESFERVFGTPHGVELGPLCAAHGVPYEHADSPAQLRSALRQASGLRVVEIRTDRGHLRELHRRLRCAVEAAIL
ncbi:2-succinyl-5-enolpyruvyl-6-hydroxy-3-cyclohexene-1-carboxylate synthase [Longimycelium tulufanense]|uniref:2-succinyl-5-enolpyruvyl-6-hydroxy-3-cyclohexene-1-carboxylate synthase n=1 Tax=Longimycelium tulufanense TaxID=907463 RepID=A0A8J3CKT9_9PSEU|nr:2-succinyl-5-enolpyruvyl-6-hydroxy-3-cyclohexene-1-carboxylic-acid synthase [Longimycelium tulufanense]GGM83917.1 2-succinyl-5-enolpyruvyl-6-hydroxy-3-cyclohexene-1-carboxylate synthase [Longimycelium tulufanense]